MSSVVHYLKVNWISNLLVRASERIRIYYFPWNVDVFSAIKAPVALQWICSELQATPQVYADAPTKYFTEVIS